MRERVKRRRRGKSGWIDGGGVYALGPDKGDELNCKCSISSMVNPKSVQHHVMYSMCYPPQAIGYHLGVVQHLMYALILCIIHIIKNTGRVDGF